MVTVRPRTEADFEPLEQVLISCHATHGWPLEGLPNARDFIDDPHAPVEQAWVAEVEGQIVGHIAITKAVPENPAVALWLEQGESDNVAVVGRLFALPDRGGKSRGVTRALVDACDAWSLAHRRRLIMYCVVWNAARRLMCQILAARFGWVKFGDSKYLGTDDIYYPAACYAQPLEPFVAPAVRDTMLARAMLMSNLGMWALWSNVSSESLALMLFPYQILMCHLRSMAHPHLPLVPRQLYPRALVGTSKRDQAGHSLEGLLDSPSPFLRCWIPCTHLYLPPI